MADLNLDATKAVVLVVATTFVMPFAKWAAVKVFGDVERSGRQLHELVNQLSLKLDDRFTSLRTLIEGQNLSIRELQIELKHQDGRMTKLEGVVAKIPDEIERSRHTLRNELTPLIMKVQLRGKDEGDE